MNTSPYLSIGETAAYLNVSKTKIRTMVAEGERKKAGNSTGPDYLRAINFSSGTSKMGNRWRIERTEIEAFVTRKAL